MSAPKILDLDAALERVEQDRELYADLVQTLIEEYETGRVSLEQALVRKDAGEVENVAHSLKSALGNIGAMAAFEAARALELAGKRGDLQGAAQLLERLRTEVVDFQAEFQRVMHG